MYLRAPSRWQLVLLGATLSTLAACVSTPYRTASADDSAAQALFVSEGGRGAASLPVTAGFYRVNTGDTLGSIAKSFGRAPAAVARWNKMATTDVVVAGRVLRVAPPPDETAGSAVAVKPEPASAPAAVLSSAEANRFRWPASGPVSAKFVAGQSKGIELGGRAGDTVKAAEGGKVVYAGSSIKPYGRLIIIKHDSHYVTAYGNARKLLVAEGAVVAQGQSIAEMGTDAGGKADLIFEVRKDGKPVDPLAYLPKRTS